MILLGIDTSTFFGSIALVETEKVIAEGSLNVHKTHSGRLLPGINRILEDTGITLDQIDGFAVTTGPGSFTGLRIGLSTVKTLALVTGKSVAGISSLDVLAGGILSSTSLISVILDARRGELYTALYRNNANGKVKRLTEYQALSPTALLEKITEPVLFVGDGIPLYRDQLQKECGQTVAFAPADSNYPRAAVLCRLAKDKFDRQETMHPRDIQALYIRPSDAEINFRK